MSPIGQSEPLHRPRILLIDDDEGIREFISQALSDEGYEVVCAAHGAAGLRLLESERFAVVLLDIRMPIMDGRTFLREYLRRPGPRARIVALSATQESADDTLPHKVDGFLSKPFNLDEMIDLIDSIARPLG
jgi:CheY-like chemotaxis protein